MFFQKFSESLVIPNIHYFVETERRGVPEADEVKRQKDGSDSTDLVHLGLTC